mmetsp:Transcript_99045/g.317693  ORF Transcript_99045/g.317693 Transcript_99045/m.317693 type:complete len:245 (-) Transcript_99045:352-1086(-)
MSRNFSSYTIRDRRSKCLDLRRTNPLVVNVDLEHHHHALVQTNALGKIVTPHVEQLLVGALLPALYRALLGLLCLLRELLLHVGREDHRRVGLDEAPTRPPIPQLDLSAVHLRIRGLAVFQILHRQGPAFRQSHVVGLQLVPRGLPESELNLDVLHAQRLLRSGVNLRALHSDLGGRGRALAAVALQLCAGLQVDVTEADPRVEKSECPSVAGGLTSNKRLLLGVERLLQVHGLTARQSHILGP